VSIYGINVPPPDEHDYHADREQQRVEAAKKLIDPSDILSIIDRRIAAEADPTKHPLYGLVLFCLDRQVAVHGGEFWDTWKRQVMAAIDTALDDVLEAMED
jgi:hypothetical protein